MTERMIKRFITYCVVLSCILTGCSDRIGADSIMVAGQEVDVRLDIAAAPVRSAVPDTKAGFIDPSTQESVDVENLWVLQFDGTDGTSKLLKACYYPNYTPATSVRLFTSTVSNTILLVANTADPGAELANCHTLSDAEKVGRAVITDVDATGGQTAGRWNMIMNGKTAAVITDGMAPIGVSLVRNAVRIDVTINNSTGSTANPVTVNSVSVCTGAKRLYYYTDYTLPSIYPIIGDDEKGYTFPATDWTSGTGSGDTRQFTFYVPANKRGMVSNGVPADKPRLAPLNSTYLLILGTDSQSKPVAYRFYLGADLVQDCNLLPGYRYSYTINLTSAGDSDTDARVENLLMQDFTTAPLANSYMVQPPSVEGIWKSVRVPVKRVHDFWNVTDGYEKVNNNALEPGCFGWQMEIILSTVELVEDVNFKWIKRTGTDYTDYFEFAIPAGLEGNFLLGIHRYTDVGQTLLDDVFLWSWHFWLTDYNPDATIRLLTPESDADGYESRYVYDVVGGQVHRFYGNIWKTGASLENEYMMDRNLGAMSATEVMGKGALYYQFGRKDPFVLGTIHLNTYKGPFAYNRYNTESDFPYRTWTQLSNAGIEDDLVRYSIYHPEIEILVAGTTNAFSWNRGDMDADGIKYSMSRNWYDTKLGTNVDAKSIFDPCPPGWRVAPQNSMSTPTGTVTSEDQRRMVHRKLTNGVEILYPNTGHITQGWSYGQPAFEYTANSTYTVWANSAVVNNNNVVSGSSGYLVPSGTEVSTYMRHVRCVSYTEP